MPIFISRMSWARRRRSATQRTASPVKEWGAGRRDARRRSTRRGVRYRAHAVFGHEGLDAAEQRFVEGRGPQGEGEAVADEGMAFGEVAQILLGATAHSAQFSGASSKKRMDSGTPALRVSMSSRRNRDRHRREVCGPWGRRTGRVRVGSRKGRAERPGSLPSLSAPHFGFAALAVLLLLGAALCHPSSCQRCTCRPSSCRRRTWLRRICRPWPCRLRPAGSRNRVW